MIAGLNFGSTPDEIENQRKRLLLYASAALGTTFLSTFCVVSFVQGRTLMAFILLLFVGIVLACAYLAKVLVQVQRVCLFLGLVLFFLSSYLLLGGGADGTGAYWSYAVTMLMVLLVGPKIGMLYMALYLLLNSLALSSSLPFVYAYSDISVSRIISTSVILYTLILASEWIRIGSYGAISSASESYRAQANSDPLTHILNRHGVQSRFKARPLGSSAALVMIDVDHFKNINDTHGHDFGDRVLVYLAESLKKHTKGGDIVGRWGGEEFLVVLYGTSIDSAAELICRIKDNFHSEPLSNNATRVPVTFSAGIANLDRVEDFESAVLQADKRLYMAKEQGRNRVVTG
ncbi:GGDEF domain-containing protein [Pseudomonas saliphila]|uniref:GGDEF domain-containing protein n=1 Tax=Pseudomonas saliphila TaxID=2586906 RepID=UPI0012394B8C|nr:GGDEF domain-containing protein [Pseudomonas saliphila]